MKRTKLFLMAIILTGCGKITTNVRDYHPIEEEDTIVIPAPTVGGCYYISDGIYVENEGNHIDVYNNDDCDHGPSPKFAYCDNVSALMHCGVSNVIIYHEGIHSDMTIHVQEL